MREEDLDEFKKSIDYLAELTNKQRPSAQYIAACFRFLEKCSIIEVKKAFREHVEDPKSGAHFPSASEILSRINLSKNNMPTYSEAWGIALRALDHQASVVWTEEIESSLYAARPILDAGDVIGARLAFRDAYERLVSDAVKKNKQIAWKIKVGSDHAKMKEEIMKAKLLGRADFSSLSTDVKAKNDVEKEKDWAPCPQHIREQLAAFKFKKIL